MLTIILAWLPFILVFIASLYQPFDADLGWHLKYGEYFFENGQILRDNLFSSEMPNFHWVNSSWGTDLISYFFYHNFSFFGLTVLSAGVMTATFYFFSKAFRLTTWQQTLLFPMILYFTEPVAVVSFRGQLLSLMLLGLLAWILRIYNEKPKIALALPVLFMVWSNLHGEFLLGLAVLGLWLGFNLVTEIFVQRTTSLWLGEVGKQFAWSGIIMAMCGLATLVNPFGIGVYQEALKHFANPWQQYIIEWLPFEELSHLWWNQVITGILILFGLLFIFFEGKIKAKLPWIGVSLVMLFMSFAVKRYAWLMYFLSLSLIYPLPDFVKPSSEKVTKLASLTILSGLILLVVFLKWPLSQFTNYNWDSYCQKYSHCSPKAVQFLIDNRLDQNLLTYYNWGGYLIWNYPEIKPSIDGRMHLWQDFNGYSAFAYYYPFEQNMTDINRSKYKVVLMGKEKPMAKRLAELANEGKWKLVYVDQTAVIYIRLKEHIE